MNHLETITKSLSQFEERLAKLEHKQELYGQKTRKLVLMLIDVLNSVMHEDNSNAVLTIVRILDLLLTEEDKQVCRRVFRGA